MQQERQRDGMSKVSENGDSSGSGIVGGRAGRGSGSPKKRKRHSLFDAIKERIRLKKNLSTPEQDRDQTTPDALGLDHKAGLELLSLLDSCSAVGARTESLRERMLRAHGETVPIRSEKKLFRLILGPAIESLRQDLLALTRLRGSALPLSAVNRWLEMSAHIASVCFGHRTKDAKYIEYDADALLAEQERQQEECLQWCEQLVQGISDLVGPALRSHVDAFKQWLSRERWRLHNDPSYKFDPWYNKLEES